MTFRAEVFRDGGGVIESEGVDGGLLPEDFVSEVQLQVLPIALQVGHDLLLRLPLIILQVLGYADGGTPEEVEGLLRVDLEVTHHPNDLILPIAHHAHMLHYPFHCIADLCKNVRVDEFDGFTLVFLAFKGDSPFMGVDSLVVHVIHVPFPLD
eukprot:CAMPEP_0170548192 /NCGR_PEP_ID=MMETSP0211-20121228/6526_1 /TAXON_ID=311385 /ORGANISM="Pseudokeronopsis sp., Strain OXSARD2" /LENGTH=152 /DNA_ID=CAMNT_0010853607 /DNA_START=1208 /DNA_END=1667 /DNA_ORIENTATION=-